jgi:hypothetical protein
MFISFAFFTKILEKLLNVTFKLYCTLVKYQNFQNEGTLSR